MNIKLMNENAVIPTKGSKYAAGLDLYSTDDYCIWTGDTIMIDTGIAVEIPKGYFGAVFARSGLATKRNLALANGVGVVDCDYRNTIKVPLHNLGQGRQWIKKGDRIAQLVIVSYVPVDLEIVDELSETERGMGGFGSTGR